MKPLLDSLSDLGAETSSTDGRCPISIKGRIKGGETSIKCTTSQYLSSLLICTPMADEDTVIRVQELNEKSYVKMTLDWLAKHGIEYEEKNLEYFKIYGGQKYEPFTVTIPADFSSATFPICAGVMCGKEVVISGLDMNDSQGDKAIIDILKKMGADITWNDDDLVVKKSVLVGREIDLNDTPDALPALSVIGCYAHGTTVLKNVPQARLKETDRIAVMTSELKKMGAEIEEREDGLIIKHSRLKGSVLRGYNDHRVVMALSLAGLIADGKTKIDSAESINITFPNYDKLMNAIGANMIIEDKEE
jgi:3-phosphoshikimate 1-carboxyvinyltransferase